MSSSLDKEAALQLRQLADALDSGDAVVVSAEEHTRYGLPAYVPSLISVISKNERHVLEYVIRKRVRVST